MHTDVDINIICVEIFLKLRASRFEELFLLHYPKKYIENQKKKKKKKERKK